MSGVPPYRYVLMTRVDVAKKRLRESAAPIGTIALEVGFRSQSQFNRVFKKLAGVTPGRYRHSLRG